MLITEKKIVNDREFIHTYSDEKRYVVRDGVEYCEALDPVDSGRTYIEGDYIDGEPPSEIEEKAKAYDIITGVSE